MRVQAACTRVPRRVGAEGSPRPGTWQSSARVGTPAWRRPWPHVHPRAIADICACALMAAQSKSRSEAP
eukprot:7683417-Alexandrium_andersonii.AAC.1